MLQAFGDKAKTSIMTIPALQDVLRRAVNLRSDLLDQLDQRMEGVAKRLNLATRKEMKAMRRKVRELENQVLGLEGQLAQERRRAEQAEGSLTEALRSARDAEAKARKLAEAKPEPKSASEAADDKPDADDSEKVVGKRASRTKKKPEADDAG